MLGTLAHDLIERFARSGECGSDDSFRLFPGIHLPALRDAFDLFLEMVQLRLLSLGAILEQAVVDCL